MTNQIDDYLVQNSTKIFGVSPNSFSRIIPADFIENYKIICFKNRGETVFAKKDTDTFCVEEVDPNTKLKFINTDNILSTSLVMSEINKYKSPWILIYSPRKKTDILVEEQGWNLIGNSFETKKKFDNKKNFRDLLSQSGVLGIPGETLSVLKLGENYENLVQKYGATLVYQMDSYTGGGIGTAFINSKADHEKFIQKIARINEIKTRVENIVITKFIDCYPASVVACATKSGVVVGSVQVQIQDIAEVSHLGKGSGVYAGHDFSFLNEKQKIKEEAINIARKIGNTMYKQGYKGIFGIDLLIDLNTNQIYPVECNPRYTDAFPVVSMIHLSKNLTPLDYYHIKEFIGLPIEENLEEESQKLVFNNANASQLILDTKLDKRSILKGEIKAGVYQFDDNGSYFFVKDGYRYEDLQAENQFVVTEGVPFKNTKLRIHERIFRLIFKKGILVGKNQLSKDVLNLIKSLYHDLRVEELNWQDEE